MFKTIGQLLPKKEHKICIGSNAHLDTLGYAAETESINALKGAGKNIQVTFKIDSDGNPYNIRAVHAKDEI